MKIVRFKFPPKSGDVKKEFAWLPVKDISMLGGGYKTTIYWLCWVTYIYNSKNGWVLQ